MKKIIVPLDFSEHSIYALDVAAAICRKDTECTIHLVHIYEKPISGISLQFNVDTEALHELKETIHDKFDEVVKNHLQGIDKIERTFAPDIAVKDILELEALHGTDLIVMGTYGAKGWREKIIGSNAQLIVRNALCPVLVVKDKITNFKMENIVFVSDFLEEAEVSYQKIKLLLNLFNPKVHLLKVFEDSIEDTEDEIEEMGEFIDFHSLKNYTINYRMASSVEEGLEDFCKEVDADVVLIETHGRKGIDRFMQSSIAENLVNNLHRPVVTIKIQ